MEETSLHSESHSATGKDETLRVTLKQTAASYGTTVNQNENSVPICDLTSEALPRMTNYKDDTFIKRPSLGELHGDYNVEKSINKKFSNIPESAVIVEEHGYKLGWIEGVFIPCILNILGVMLFLRMPWIVSQSGIFQTIVIIIISTAICVSTTLSLSALCTNGEIKGGGIYFIISRSLGLELGASVGIVLAFNAAVSASLNTIGFCESLNDLLWQKYHTKILDNDLDFIRVVGVIAILIMVLICANGVEWAAKADNLLVALILIACVDFFVGTFLGPQNDPLLIAQGFNGFSFSLFAENWVPHYGVGNNFFAMFALFFPSVTGIQTGANISGDLKDPNSAIPKGTLLSLLASMILYLSVVICSGGAAVREASGEVSEVNSHTYLDCWNRTCTKGLQNDYMIMSLMSVWGIWIYLGCFAATLSTALTNLLTVPRLLKAVGDDHIYPGLSYFAKGYGKNQEPYRGFVLTFFFSSAFVLIASIDIIAPLITNFYLASYALINFCTFHAALVRPLGWRPTFRYYNKWLSLFTCCLCIALMFFIDWITSTITFATFFTLYLIVVYRQPDVNWGSTTQAQMYKSTLESTYRLINVSEHVKNYQPHILLLSGKPSMRPALLDLANLITKRSALLICGNIITEKLSYKQRQYILRDMTTFLNKRKIKAFCSIVDGLKFEDGASAIMQCCGIGKLCPNILMMGYKDNWRTSSEDDLQTYFNLLHNAFDNRLSVAILRMPKTMNSSPAQGTVNGAVNIAFIDEINAGWSRNSSDNNLKLFNPDIECCTMPKDSPCPVRRNEATEVEMKKVFRTEYIIEDECNNKYPVVLNADGNKESMVETMFSTKLKNGVIDVWWLYDDGGLTMLLPYILNTRSIWSDSVLRIFALTSDKNKTDAEQQNLASLLAKFRIRYSNLTMLSDIEKPSYSETRIMFETLIEPYRKNSNSKSYVSEIELKALEDKTNRQLRLKELLKQHSVNSDLVVMSLPMPRKGVVSASVYTAWLEILSSDMPPFLFVRGNHTPVLTFYS